MRLEARTVVPPSLDKVKMEERKRPGGSEDQAPPAKRQAVAVNGVRSHPDADLPWKEDIEVRPPDCPYTRPARPPPKLSANSAILYRPFRRMPFSARCASTSARRLLSRLSFSRLRAVPNTTTTTSAQSTHGLIRSVHTAFDVLGCCAVLTDVR